LALVRHSLEDLVPELIFIEQIAEVAEVKVLDVPTVREKSGIESGGNDGPPQYRPSLNSE